MVERRLSERRTQPVDVTVRTRSGPMGVFTCRNWSSDGLFIVTAGRASLDVNDAIWVTAVDEGAEPWGHAMLGIVVHRTHDGVGVILSEPLQSALPLQSARV